jgi:hypothetical protein
MDKENSLMEAIMAIKVDPLDLISFRELLIANSIQLDTITQMLIDKGIFTSDEFYARLKQVQIEYMSRQ